MKKKNIIITEKLTDALRALIYDIFLENFFIGKEKNNWFFTTFYIIHEIGIKFSLDSLLTNALKTPVNKTLIIIPLVIILLVLFWVDRCYMQFNNKITKD